MILNCSCIFGWMLVFHILEIVHKVKEIQNKRLENLMVLVQNGPEGHVGKWGSLSLLCCTV